MSFDPQDRGPIGESPDPLIGFIWLHRLDNWLEGLLGGWLVRAHKENHERFKAYHPPEPRPKNANDWLDRLANAIEDAVVWTIRLAVELFLELLKLLFGFVTVVTCLFMAGPIGLANYSGTIRNPLWVLVEGMLALAVVVFFISLLHVRNRSEAEPTAPFKAERAIRNVRIFWLFAALALFVAGFPLMGAALLLQMTAFYFFTESKVPLRVVTPSPPREPNGTVRLFGRSAAEAETVQPRGPLLRTPWRRRRSPVGEE